MCGIVGIYQHDKAAILSYMSLYALQHRGQEGVGIVSSDGRKTFAKRGAGLVSEVFADQKQLEKLPGRMALGHVRYSTHGGSRKENIQPLIFNYKGNQLSIAHNGNLINWQSKRDCLEDKGAIFQSSSDTEFIIHLLAHSRGESFEQKLVNALKKVRGAYSLILMYKDTLIAARDRQGFRPLCIGKLGSSIVFASETCALDIIGAEYIRDVAPGEVCVVNNQGEHSLQVGAARPKHCIFEYIYFSRPDSRIFGDYVDKTRRKLGKTLAIENPAPDADIVISVPDSSNTTALGYARRSECKFEIGLIRNHYIGRTFIHPKQWIRDFTAKLKFNPVGGVLRDRSVVIVDDSIVRGTTLKKLVKMIRKTKPKKIHVRISCPPVRFPCYYGMDFPSPEELIANQKSVEDIRKYLNVDSLCYLSVDGMLKSMSLPKSHFCTACFTGKYAIPNKENHKG